jgi:hypothetical protein
MTLKEFFNVFELDELKEIDKVSHAFYFLSKSKDVESFTRSDIGIWFRELNLAEPNMSRLISNIKSSKHFIKANGFETYRLTPKMLKIFNDIYKDASFQRPDRPKTDARHFIHPERIIELKKIQSSLFDLRKVIQICTELNESHAAKNYLSIILLTRSLIDHIPPVFGAKSFAQVASSYAGTKSFKESMTHLEESSRKIADQHLHTQIRNKEVLPNFNQVDFSNDVDVLLSEVVRILK